MKPKFLIFLATAVLSSTAAHGAIIIATSTSGGSTSAFPTLIDSETNPTIHVFGPLASTGSGSARAIRFFLDQRNGTFPEFFISGGPLDLANTFINGVPASDSNGNGRADLIGDITFGTNTIISSALPDPSSNAADSGNPGDLQLVEFTFDIVDTNGDSLFDFNDLSGGGEGDTVTLTSARYGMIPIPEPSSAALLALAGLGLVARRKR